MIGIVIIEKEAKDCFVRARVEELKQEYQVEEEGPS